MNRQISGGNIIMQMMQILDKFKIDGSIVHAEEYGNGHINKTYLVTTDRKEKFILQQINTHVFRNPKDLMQNIALVTSHIRRKTIESGGDASRVALEIIGTRDKKNYVKYKDNYWRCYRYIEGAKTYEKIEDPKQFYEVGKAVGKFQNQLQDLAIKKLHITIPDFHNTPKRYDHFFRIASADRYNLAMDIFNEIKFVFDRKNQINLIEEALSRKIIPVRVTHNDTKLNNVMLDEVTGEAICIIDLDTVMPGSLLYDFGDAIRIGASTALEDEKDLSKVQLDLNLFSLFTRGFLEALDGNIEEEELKLLVASTKIITLECGMRFLTDYLDGNTYFRIDYEEHNLIRARNQFKLVTEIERLENDMQKIVDEQVKELNIKVKKKD